MVFPLVPLIAAVAPTVVNAITGAASKPADRLGKDDFLKLLVAQLQHQDPLDPVANDQFISQSAMFSSLEELQNIRKGVESMGGGNTAVVSGAGALIGKDVAATSGRFAFKGEAVTLPFTLSAPVANAWLEVTDASGTVVGQQQLGSLTAGKQSTLFTPQSGQVLASGEYRYRIVSMDGARGTALPAITGTVTGVSLTGTEPVLQLGAVSIALSDVTRIGTPTH